MSQPEKMVPTTSKTPTSASSPAAVVSAIPWSCAAGMKWVPISPFVDQPQTQKVKNRAQKVHVRPACLRVLSATTAAPGPDRSVAGST